MSIEFVGPATAMATLRCSIRPKHFVDDRWQIIAKVFHWEEQVGG